ncbi:MAG: hypothetical protein ACJ8M1_15210 [Chthoniobacterales bacterium]
MQFRNSLVRSLAATFLCLAVAASADADTIMLDPDGGGNAPKLSLGSFQFAAGNSLFSGALPFTVGNSFQLLFQAPLAAVVSETGALITPVGLNAPGSVGGTAPYEITVVGSATEKVTNVNLSPERAVFRLADTQSGASFVEIYFDSNRNANPLQGTGYNDGTLILAGIPLPSTPDGGVFSQANPQPSPASDFDSFTHNEYASAGPSATNVTSISGIGATKLDVTITYVNPAFFVAPASGDAGRQVQVGDIVTLSISHETPFDKVDPSLRFDGTPNSGVGAGPTPSATPNVGAMNGNSGSDLQAQSMISSSIRTATPTPAPTVTPTPSPTVTPTPTPTPTASPTPTSTPNLGAKVVISANRAQMHEGGADAIITFHYKGPTSHGAVTVNYSTGGNAVLNTDYTLTGTPGTVVIPANGTTATIVLHAIPDNVKEGGGEVVKIFVEAGTGYEVPAQTDASRVSILILDPAP